MAALDDLRDMVNAEGGPTLNDLELQAALDSALVPDSAGVWPGQPGYQPTYDLYWAAAETCVLRATRAALQATETVTRVTSEGTTIEATTTPVDWAGLGHKWRTKSRIGQETGYGQTLGTISVTQPATGYVPASKALGWT